MHRIQSTLHTYLVSSLEILAFILLDVLFSYADIVSDILVVAPQQGDGPVQDRQQKQSFAIANTEMAEAPEDFKEGPPGDVQKLEEIQADAKMVAPCDCCCCCCIS